MIVEAADVTPIDNLPDSLLIGIFSNVALTERLTLSTISRRWNRLISMIWVDVKFLDSSSVAEDLFPAVAKWCTLIRVFTIKQRCTSTRHLQPCMLSPNLTTVCFYGTSIHVPLSAIKQGFAELFEQVPNLSDLTFHDSAFYVSPPNLSHIQLIPFSSFNLPQLRHCQLSNLGHLPAEEFEIITMSLSKSSQLESLIFAGVIINGLSADDFVLKLNRLVGLKELSISKIRLHCIETHNHSPLLRQQYISSHHFTKLNQLPCLKFLILSHILFAEESLGRLCDPHLLRSLRILILPVLDSGHSQEIRVCLPRFHAHGSIGHPRLEVFMGNHLYKSIRFESSYHEHVQPINETLPSFIEQRALFQDSWVAQQIIESPKFNAELWGNEVCY